MNAAQVPQLPGISGTMVSPIGVCWEAKIEWREEEQGWEVHGYLDVVTGHPSQLYFTQRVDS